MTSLVLGGKGITTISSSQCPLKLATRMTDGFSFVSNRIDEYHGSYNTPGLSQCMSRRRWGTSSRRRVQRRFVRGAETRNENGDPPSSIDQTERCDTGDPTIDLCAAAFEESTLSPNAERDAVIMTGSVTTKQKSAIVEAYDRGKWLIGLLVLQSSSSFVLDSYQDLIREHLVVTLFLTMLVGAGGNAGNQSAIKVIRGMAMGSITPSLDSLTSVLRQQVAVALILGTSLSAAGWFRVYVTNGDVINSTAIALSLFLIVCTSVIVGTLLPFGLARAGQDPANAGTSIQVLMDVLGVLITCTCCHYILDEFATATL